MRTVGEILKEARLRNHYSLEQVASQTKIRVFFLKAIEENNFPRIPQATITRGFIRNYAQILGLSPDSVLAVFRRDFLEDEKGQIIPRGMVAPLNKIKFSWNPKLTVITLLTLFFVVFLGFWARQYLNFISSPKILVTYPQEGQIFDKKEVEFFGTTDKDATLYINGEIINLGPSGDFNKKIVLKEGENEIILEAVNRAKQKTRLVRKVSFFD